MLIRSTDIHGQQCDVRISKGLIVEVGADLTPEENVMDCGGFALIPGLHDHHIHLNASAAAMNSVRCGPPEVMDAPALIKAINQPGQGWLRGVGYHHSVAGEIDRAWLDEHGPKRPVRIQHRGGRMWVLNRLAMEALALNEPANGRLVDGDLVLRENSEYPNLEPLINRLLSFGITGVTEVTPSNTLSEFEHYLAKTNPLRLCVMGRAELGAAEHPSVGPVKLHYHEYDLPALDDLAQEVKAAHKSGRAVAVHCVTRAELMLTLAAIDMAGPLPGDRIEHAAIADNAAIAWMAELGVIVVTQPNFIAERHAAYAVDVPKDDHANLWRLASFSQAGLRTAAGSDSPFGDVNPWKAMAAAVNRPIEFDNNEGVSPEEALALYTKPADDAAAPPRRIAPGQLADFCILDRPWGDARQDLADVKVQSTWIGGQCVYDAKRSK